MDIERGFDAIDALREIADEHGAAVANVALALLLAKPGVSSVILGASRPEQLAANLQAQSSS